MIAQTTQLDPWFSMWTRPRATIRQVIDSDSRGELLVLAILNGIISAFNNAANQNAGDLLAFPLLIVACLAGGAISGLISLYLFGALLTFVGHSLGGRGSFQDVQAAMAWGAIPTIWTALLLVPELIIFREELFSERMPRMEATPALALLLVVFGLLQAIVGLWAAVVTLKSLGEAHGFSAWRALLTSILSGLVLALPIICLVGGLTLLGAHAR